MTHQLTTLVNHFRRAGSITQREAMAEYSIQSLTKRISELNALGHPITREFRSNPVTGQRYARYHYDRTKMAIQLGYSA